MANFLQRNKTSSDFPKEYRPYGNKLVEKFRMVSNINLISIKNISTSINQSRSHVDTLSYSKEKAFDGYEERKKNLQYAIYYDFLFSLYYFYEINNVKEGHSVSTAQPVT